MTNTKQDKQIREELNARLLNFFGRYHTLVSLDNKTGEYAVIDEVLDELETYINKVREEEKELVKKKIYNLPICTDNGVTDPDDPGSFIEGQLHFLAHCKKILEEGK